MDTEKHTTEDTLVSYNPATGEEIGRVKIASTIDVENAVADSRLVLEIWRKTPFAERARNVMRAREMIITEIDEIAELISNEVGKPITEALSSDIIPALDLMQYFAKNSEKLLRTQSRGIGLLSWFFRYSKIAYRPIGVIGIISPWNFPLSIPLGEIVMALMAGNTVVLKPSEFTPLVGEKIADIFKKARLPRNVLRVISGDGKTGAALIDAGVDKIMFTGSVATGKKVASSAANSLTPVVLELGGKDPMIVLEDANLEAASSAAVWGAFSNSGQACASVERLYVNKKVYSKFLELIVAKTSALRQGFGNNPNTDIGSMSSKNQFEIVERHVEEFKKAGANVVTGGKQADNLGDNFFQPTIITDVENKMLPMQEETFGPTLPIAVFETEEEAISLANDSEFGLTASVWTANIARGRKIASKIEAGTVTINEVLYTHGIAQTPWGGIKKSGYGRTHGKEGLMELVTPQHIHVNRFTFTPDVWWFGYSEDSVNMFKKMSKTFASGSLLRSIGFLPQLWKRTRELISNNKKIDNK